MCKAFQTVPSASTLGCTKVKKADLEIGSLAAIEWANSIRYSAKMIDPSDEIRVEFLNARESSLSIGTILVWGEALLERLEKILSDTKPVERRIASPQPLSGV